MRGLIATAIAATTLMVCGGELEVSLLPGEGWWGGATTHGMISPLGLNAKSHSFDIRKTNYANQAAPLMLTTKGRCVWSDKAFACTFTNGVMKFTGDAPIVLTEEGPDLRSAFLSAARKHFPPSGKTPDLELIAKPQWNTWVELAYNQSQEAILEYARDISANGFPKGGVIMIDDTWQHAYGVWDFDRRRFSDPKAMCDELHAEGFKVMLWVCPFVSMDTPGYREMVFGTLDAGRICEKGGLIMTGEKNVYGHDVACALPWWNGVSAFVDFTHPRGAKWFSRQLKRLQADYGVDGFKLDAGDIEEYQEPYVTHVKSTPSELCEAYAKIGLEFPLNEYRACFKMAGQPLVQRLCDKLHDWPSLHQLMPDMIACGLLGHSFVCPDMIGGGSWMAFAPDAPTPLDQELFVRSAQVHALAPMMQFSAAPWRLLKGEYLDAVRAAAETRMKHVEYILDTARECAKTGEPMLRAMEYEFPGLGAEGIIDQFMLGSELLVAPQVIKGAKTRKVFVPVGTWVADDGTEVVGPRYIEVETPISRLPHFVRKSTAAHTFTVEGGEFLLDGKPFTIRCGEVHFARVPKAYWAHRLKMVKACGFNAVCAYLFWNYHEMEEGKIDFSGERDVAEFCRLAQKEGLWVILRPGPYTCAEWDLGGHPWWLLAKDGINLRSTDPKYLKPAKRYLEAVGRELSPLQVTRGGPILMVQAENEYGSYGDDANYMREIWKSLKDVGFEVPIFACNAREVLKRGYIPELMQVVNFGSDPAEAFAELRALSPNGPLMCGEFYPAWFDTWGRPHNVKSADECLRDLKYMLERKASFSVYMAHGGTTFGWWAGCNWPFLPEVSSYDYDAPISEAGWTTPKFMAMRDLFAKYLNPGETIPDPPCAIPLQKGSAPLVAETADIFALAAASKRLESESPVIFEKAGLGYGLAVYETTIPAGIGGALAADVRDLGVVRVAGAEVGFLDRRDPKATVDIPAADAPRKLEILVEPMGRYNFSDKMIEGIKGVVGDVTLGGKALKGWRTAYFTYDQAVDLPKYGQSRSLASVGTTSAGSVHRLVIELEAGKDTFLDMSGFRRGLVRLNGRWLGRYWAIGPTQTMYVPGCWLKDGGNELVIIDTVGSPIDPQAKLVWRDKPILDVNAPEKDYFKSR